MWFQRVPSGAEIAEPARKHIHSRLNAAFAAAVLCMAAGAAHAAEPAFETVVVAEAAPRASRDDAASSSVITAARTPRSAEDLPQLLAELPGVSVTRMGGLGSLATLSLRGSSANQVEVYFDGVPLSAASGGGVDVGLIPVVDLGSVEVYRGMSPIAFGASAIGGIVSLSSTAATDSGVRAYAGGGSFGTEFAGAQARWAGKNLRALASVNALGGLATFPIATTTPHPSTPATIPSRAARTMPSGRLTVWPMSSDCCLEVDKCGARSASFTAIRASPRKAR